MRVPAIVGIHKTPSGLLGYDLQAQWNAGRHGSTLPNHNLFIDAEKEHHQRVAKNIRSLQ